MVSVIIPIYNTEKYLRQCVNSVLAQTYSDLEIILVNDGSPDKCGDICNEYAATDSRIVVVHKENGGLSDARNAGLDVATGEYIYFLDSDDYIETDAIERLVRFMEGEEADIVCLNKQPFTEESEFKIYKEKLIRYPVCSGAKNILFRFQKEKEWFPGAPLQFYKTEFLKREKMRFKKGLLYEDLLFNGIAYVRADKVSPINSFLYHYRVRNGSILNRKMTEIDFQSYHICAQGFIDEKKRYPAGSEQEKALDCLMLFAARRYCESLETLGFFERFCFVKESRAFARDLKAVRTQSNKKRVFILNHIMFWSVYRKMKAMKRKMFLGE